MIRFSNRRGQITTLLKQKRAVRVEVGDSLTLEALFSTVLWHAGRRFSECFAPHAVPQSLDKPRLSLSAKSLLRLARMPSMFQDILH